MRCRLSGTLNLVRPDQQRRLTIVQFDRDFKQASLRQQAFHTPGAILERADKDHNGVANVKLATVNHRVYSPARAICQYSSSIGACRPKMVTSTRTRPLSGSTSSTVPS